ncbi:hypothetical protein DM02DRAFT_728951 [Periconia macrospinosa]|uniref:Uncharacterized protein n=1 Tax=Periconia macrospinosa TaxID=97972 RepID=A0A2V1DNM8_9PLEO|nr:hypothetical protein DM02DRAFT_728951 [Periconia macrospinosa]
MKFALLPLLLSSIPLVQSQMPVGSTMRCNGAVWTDKSWAEAKNNMAKMGNCLYYKGGDPGYDISTCGKGCEGGVEAVGCMAKYPEGLEDPKGRCFWGGTCICPKDVEWVGDLIVMIVDALNDFFQKIVDAIVCSGILDAILMTVDIGLSLIPGGAIASTAMRTGIRIAKSVAEAGSDRSAFEEWFGAQCGTKPTDIDKVWKEWTGVPDDVLPSFPGGECVKSGKKKKSCKKEPSKEDDEKREKEAKEKWEKEHEKKSSKKEESKSTSPPKTQTSPKPTSVSASKTSSKISATSNSSAASQSSSKAPSSSKASASSATPTSSKASASSKVPSSSKSTGGTKTQTASASSSKGSTVTSKSAATSKSVASTSASKHSTSRNSTQITSKPSATSSAPPSSTSSAVEDEDEDDSEKPNIPGLFGAITSMLNLTTSAKPTSTSAPVFLTSGPGN